MRKRICKATGCCRTVDADSGARYCTEHIYLERAEGERRLQGFALTARHNMWPHLYGSPKWRQMRADKLREFPQCEMCGEKATEVHHVVPHDGDLSIFYDKGNLQALCHSCHCKQTSAEMKERRKAAKEARRKLWY